MYVKTQLDQNLKFQTSNFKFIHTYLPLMTRYMANFVCTLWYFVCTLWYFVVPYTVTERVLAKKGHSYGNVVVALTQLSKTCSYLMDD